MRPTRREGCRACGSRWKRPFKIIRIGGRRIDPQKLLNLVLATLQITAALGQLGGKFGALPFHFLARRASPCACRVLVALKEFE